MKTLVIDSSVIVKWLNQDNEKDIAQADKILQDAQQKKVELIAPELAKYEVGNVLIKGKSLSFSQAQVVLETLFLLPITFISESLETALDTFSLGETLNVTYYDAAFLSLAKQYQATLVTENVKHQGKSKDIAVISLKEY